MGTVSGWGFGTRAPVFLCLAVSLALSAPAAANVTGIVRGVQQNPIAGALVTFINEATPAESFSGYTNAGGQYDIAIAPLAVGDVSPAPFTLHQNHPNPFNPSTTITFTTTESGFITLAIYSLLGQRVRTLVSGTVPAGEHAVVWDGRDETGNPTGAGVYLYRLAGGGRAEVKKMLLLDGGSVSSRGVPVAVHAAPKPAAVTWTVTITGDEIEPREMNGLEIADGGTYDFYVIFMGEVTNFHLVEIPGGTFEMGEVWTTFIDSLLFGPAHPVSVSDFEMSAYEITNSQYTMFLNEAFAAGEIEMIDGDPYGQGGAWDGQRFIDLDVYVPPYGNDVPLMARYPEKNCQIMYNNGSFTVENSNRRHWPVVAVSWYGAKAFAQHYGLDLPTEAEWEYAAGGGSLEYPYATDDGTIDVTKANCNTTFETGSPTPVGTYTPNPFGLYDMTGNASEWCNDWYGRYPSDPPPNRYRYSGSTIVNPTGPSTGEDKVYRGGYYASSIGGFYDENRTAHRGYGIEPTGMSGHVTYIGWNFGFRVIHR